MSEKKIKDAIDSIEPENGAKERMYRNIMKKAQQTEPVPMPKKKPVSFVRYALPIAACLCLLILSAVHFLPSAPSPEPTDELVLGGNPFVEVEGADDFKALAITLDAPQGAQEVSYAIIDGEIAELRFELCGRHYLARASAQEGDFSGLIGEELSPETVDAKNNAVLMTVRTDGTDVEKLVWTNGKINYCLFGTDGADREALLAAYDALKYN